MYEPVYEQMYEPVYVIHSLLRQIEGDVCTLELMQHDVWRVKCALA